MATFSWTDTARAILGSCLPCLPSSGSNDSTHAARRDELESLLQGAEFTETETDADALSLHSNIGQHDGKKRPRRKHTKNRGSIRLFGYDLFGRPLPDPDIEAEEEREVHRRVSRISSSTLDSDPTQLPDHAITELFAQTAEQRAEDKAISARKRVRKQQKAAAMLDTHGNMFEGFPGSGAFAPGPDDFGAFQQAPDVSCAPHEEFVYVPSGGLDEADAEGDFDAGSYVHNTAPRSESNSGTRSHTSSSHPHLVPLPPSSSSSRASFTSISVSPAVYKPKRSKKVKSGNRSSATASSTMSQPRSPVSAAPASHIEIVSLPRNPEFEGVPQGDEPVLPYRRSLDDAEAQKQFSAPQLSDAGLERSSGFPSTGFARSRGFPTPHLGGRKNSLNMGRQGVFLARTGDDA